jgi:hypothetical protein
MKRRERSHTVSNQSPLEQWVAPTGTSRIDQVPLADIHQGWAPERTGEMPLGAALATIRAVGIVDPVMLRPRPDGGYEAVTGHRTLEAARMAGLDRVPAVVREMNDLQALSAVALDGTATGMVTPSGARELRERLLQAGVTEQEQLEDLLAAVPVAAAPPAAYEEVATAVVGEPVSVAEAVAAGAPQAAVPTPAVREGVPRSRRPVALPAGVPHLERLSSSFVDLPRLLRRLADDHFTGAVEIMDAEGRTDVLLIQEGRFLAQQVSMNGSRLDTPVRLPGMDERPAVEVTVRTHPERVVAALALALRTSPRLEGLHASFIHFPGLLGVLKRDEADAACVVSSSEGSGVVLLSKGTPIAAYVRRPGQGRDNELEPVDLHNVSALLSGGEGEVDVHDRELPPALDLEDIIATGAKPAGS